MMNNMFSMFDPSSSYMSLSWSILMLPTILLMLSKKMKKQTKKNYMISMMMMKMEKEVKELMQYKTKKYSQKMMTKTFIMLMILNTMALIPFNFTPTAHLSISMTMSLTMWLSVLGWGLMNSFKKMILHLTPMGTPNSLMNFMVLIESVSNLIRPITLSVRLSANMVAGHLLMALLANFSLMSPMNTSMTYMFMMMLTILEMMVSLIQAYVMSTLISLYHNESM